MAEKNIKGKILLISWTIPPETTGSSVIVGNLVKAFSKDEMFLFGEFPHKKPEVAWESNFPKRHFSLFRFNEQVRGTRWYRRLCIPFIFFQLLIISLREKPDRILVVFPNGEYLLIGCLLSFVLNIPLMSYFHNTYLENRKGYEKKIAAFIQGIVFKRSKKIFVMSEGMQSLYQSRYPSFAHKMTPLLHSFNEDISLLRKNNDNNKPVTQQFCFSGNINQSCQSSGIRLLNTVLKRSCSFTTILSGLNENYFHSLGVNLIPGKYNIRSVARNNLLIELNKSDIMLLPHGFESGDRMSEEEILTIFPTKTIEYLISGRPILAHCPEESFLFRFLTENNCALVISEPSEAKINEGIELLMSDKNLRDTLVENAFKTALRFHISNVKKTLIANIT